MDTALVVEALRRRAEQRTRASKILSQQIKALRDTGRRVTAKDAMVVVDELAASEDLLRIARDLRDGRLLIQAAGVAAAPAPMPTEAPAPAPAPTTTDQEEPATMEPEDAADEPDDLTPTTVETIDGIEVDMLDPETSDDDDLADVLSLVAGTSTRGDTTRP